MKLYAILIPLFFLVSTIFTACSSVSSVEEETTDSRIVISTEEDSVVGTTEDSAEDSDMSSEESSENTESDVSATSTVISADDYFTERDLDASYEASTYITLSDSGSAAEGAGVQIDRGTITISKEGTYVLTGTLSNGQIIQANQYVHLNPRMRELGEKVSVNVERFIVFSGDGKEALS